jgi:hypothetical protein
MNNTKALQKIIRRIIKEEKSLEKSFNYSFKNSSYKFSFHPNEKLMMINIHDKVGNQKLIKKNTYKISLSYGLTYEEDDLEILDIKVIGNYIEFYFKTIGYIRDKNVALKVKKNRIVGSIFNNLSSHGEISDDSEFVDFDKKEIYSIFKKEKNDKSFKKNDKVGTCFIILSKKDSVRGNIDYKAGQKEELLIPYTEKNKRWLKWKPELLELKRVYNFYLSDSIISKRYPKYKNASKYGKLVFKNKLIYRLEKRIKSLYNICNKNNLSYSIKSGGKPNRYKDDTAVIDWKNLFTGGNNPVAHVDYSVSHSKNWYKDQNLKFRVAPKDNSNFKISLPDMYWYELIFVNDRKYNILIKKYEKLIHELSMSYKKSIRPKLQKDKILSPLDYDSALNKKRKIRKVFKK